MFLSRRWTGIKKLKIKALLLRAMEREKWSFWTKVRGCKKNIIRKKSFKLEKIENKSTHKT